MKQMYYNFLQEMHKNSELLHENGNYHTACYLGGYVLEAYLKILILIGNNPGEHIREHKYKNLLERINNLRNFYPKTLKIDQYTNITNNTRKLLFGNGTSNPSWDPDKRYEINIWNDVTHSTGIQNEIKLILREIAKLKMAKGGF